jgi:hypothetical protein
MDKMNNFQRQLQIGKLGESLIAWWLKSCDYNILPIYEKEINEGKGPQLFSLSEDLIAPDLLIFQTGNVNALWIEAKHKSVFSWHRKSKRWVTGIDLRHYEDYRKISKISPWPVWLFFLHQNDRFNGRPDEPWPCPTGLYGQTGMVYWEERNLIKLAELDEVYKTIGCK